ncbi:MAG: hypothetical protein P1V18_04965 [Candidatus Gracilibacteria bacterium]|nr:hypothetical protein [Candidatus Gracilibacteria bacterium]
MKKFFSSLLIISLSFSLVACSEPQIDEDAQTVINNAWLKLADKNASYETGIIDIDGSIDIDFDSTSIELSGDGKLTFDSSDPKNVKTILDIDVDGNGTLEGQNGGISLEGEFRTLKEKLFVFLKSLSIETDDPQASFMANLVEGAFKDQWYAIPVPENDLIPSDESLLSTKNFKGKEAAEIAKKHNFFDLKEETGYRTYSLTVNPDKLKGYINAVSQLNGTETTAEDLAAVDALLLTSEYSIEVTINSEYDITWLKTDLMANDPENNQKVTLNFKGSFENDESDGDLTIKTEGEVPGTLKISFDTEHNMNTSVNITEPEGAQDFDPAQMLGLGGGL